MAESPFQVSFRTSDRHETLQNVFVEDSFRVLGRFVAHEAIDESESCLGDKNATEGQVCEIGVFCDGLFEALATELTHNFEVVVRRAGVWLGIV